MVQEVAQRDIAYEKIMAEPTVQLQILANALDVGHKVTSITHTCQYLCLPAEYAPSDVVLSAVLLSATAARHSCTTTTPLVTMAVL